MKVGLSEQAFKLWWHLKSLCENSNLERIEYKKPIHNPCKLVRVEHRAFWRYMRRQRVQSAQKKGAQS